MYGEDDRLPISALQHLLFCERQCALIHLERVWLDNALTVEGSFLHRRADDEATESRGDLLTLRTLPIYSKRLGLSGIADVVEFVRVRQDSAEGARIPGRSGRWLLRPVEYKRGRPKAHRADEVQLCAQVLCLEEMFGVPIPSGDLYYGKRRRRTTVEISSALRDLTERTVERLRALLDMRRTPPARYGPHCEMCSLASACMPKVSRSAQRYLAAEIHSQVHS